MITKFIKSLFGMNKDNEAMTSKIQITKKHNIQNTHISQNALYTLEALQQAGYKAFIVGGAVRDLLLNIKPKDFDIATNATPNQICKVFRKARIIGKRFQIVLLPFYRGKDQEYIEITTFRASLKQDDTMLIQHHSERLQVKRGVQVNQNAHNKVTVDSSGQVWNDNVWGTHAEDASRRDFTINALYYNPFTQELYDFYNGMRDIKNKTIRMIGEPNARYKEDPVRMIRVARFVAKTHFNIEKQTLKPISECASLLGNIPPARLADELLKMLISGYARTCIEQVYALGLHAYFLPWADEKHTSSHDLQQQKFIQLILKRTDERIAEQKSVSPGFIFAAIYWPMLVEEWRKQEKYHPHMEALNIAIYNILEPLQLQKRIISDMQEIWNLQPRLEKQQKASIFKILEHTKFRAGYDFLVLRSMIDAELEDYAAWWTKIQEVDVPEQQYMIDNLGMRAQKRSRNHRRRSNANKAIQITQANQATPENMHTTNTTIITTDIMAQEHNTAITANAHIKKTSVVKVKTHKLPPKINTNIQNTTINANTTNNPNNINHYANFDAAHTAVDFGNHQPQPQEQTSSLAPKSSIKHPMRRRRKPRKQNENSTPNTD
jgi:poly(A) polymerase